MEASPNARSRSEPPVASAEKRGRRSRRGQRQIVGVGVSLSRPLDTDERELPASHPEGCRIRRVEVARRRLPLGIVWSGHLVGHVYHARCVIDFLERNGEHSFLVCEANGCGLGNPRRQSIAAAIQADAGLRRRAERMIGA